MTPTTFKVGDRVRWKNNPEVILFTVAEVHDMSGYYGWEDEPQAITPQTPKGQRIFLEGSSHFILDPEYQDEVLRRIEDQFDDVLVNIIDGRLRISKGGVV